MASLRKISLLTLTILTMTLMSACGGQGDNKGADSKSGDGKKVIKAGTSVLFEAPLKAAKEDFEKISGYELEIKVFDDAVATDIALAEGDIDVNFYQHEPYLNAFNESRGTNLVRYGKKVLASDYGLYSSKIKSLDELKDGFTMSIPNDASNRGIALKFLQDQGFIKIKENVKFPTLVDIIENKRDIKFVEMDRLSLVKSLEEVDICAMPSIYMFQSGKDPKSAIVSGYDSDELAIIITLTEDNKNVEWAKHLEEALTNENSRKFIQETYKGAVKPLF
ncbi:ABC transporter D-methionine-binding lipoprotein MetQ [Gottschalkia acidurici 9a]|uniref:ABC transporter D-methionine-binding lipoprotein MetQ n=1 Tax=Gottschalkia acidurici (strain ATCC 7906 / DSM 604 / BCRC 14475 / CIP 104303 / KCTC 5404 / NCIMB 10678 / 9a) TaxID=1128398 RepID=K0AZL5_GOTA9|nr:MetQ/NlpA family ABC transporter substrate-binding protein [Gottschalkia acidurici]AFS78160.1 ABC transporter D-methionine-binding lipoprotein MetQ [Gottschalkia acidurici 9a]